MEELVHVAVQMATVGIPAKVSAFCVINLIIYVGQVCIFCQLS